MAPLTPALLEVIGKCAHLGWAPMWWFPFRELPSPYSSADRFTLDAQLLTDSLLGTPLAVQVDDLLIALQPALAALLLVGLWNADRYSNKRDCNFTVLNCALARRIVHRPDTQQRAYCAPPAIQYPGRVRTFRFGRPFTRTSIVWNPASSRLFGV